MLLTELPTDILVMLPQYLNSIDDLYSIISTCRTLHSTCNDPHIKLRPQLRRRDGQYLYQPHPHLLIAGCARQVGDWAVSSPTNRSAFHDAVRRGIPGLLTLSTEVARMSLKDMRELHGVKYTVLNPLTKRLEIENPKDEDEDFLTQLEHPDLCILNYWIYSDLFRHTIEASYRCVDVRAQLTDTIRLDYVKYCIPDENTGVLDLSLGMVQYSGLVRDERSELSFQQLDACQLAGTSFSEKTMCTWVFLSESRWDDGADPFLEHIARVLLHSGLTTLRFVLAMANSSAQQAESGRVSRAVSVDVSSADRAALQAASAIKDHIMALRHDPWYVQVQRGDSTWHSLIDDIHVLW